MEGRPGGLLYVSSVLAPQVAQQLLQPLPNSVDNSCPITKMPHYNDAEDNESTIHHHTSQGLAVFLRRIKEEDS